MNKEIVVYGASGYTGKLICWHLAEYGIPFIAAGRNKERLEAQMKLVPELEGADYDVVAVEHDVNELAKLFSGKKIVYNVVGPFIQLGEIVVEACLQAGCHYLDTTGETDWILHVKNEYSEAFKAKDIILCPATSWMWLAGQIAVEIALEDSHIDTLDICYLADSNTSVASTKSFLGMLTSDQYYLDKNELMVWPHAASYQVHIPGFHQTFTALPWGGGAEPIWYLDDNRVRNCRVMVAFRDQGLIDAVVNIVREFEEKHSHLPEQEQQQLTNEIGLSLVSEEPDREIPADNRSVISCMARGNTESRNIILRGNSPYLQTGLFAAEACKRLLLGKHREVGFSSPAVTFGGREMMAVACEHGYLSWHVHTS